MQRTVNHSLILTLLCLGGHLLSAQEVQFQHGNHTVTTYQGHVTASGKDQTYAWYVTHALLFSDALGEHTAYDKELYEYGLSIEGAARNLEDAIKSGKEVAGILPKLIDGTKAGCPVTGDGAIDIERLIDETFIVSDTESRWALALEQDRRYQDTIKGMKDRCEIERSFSPYRSEDLQIYYLPPSAKKKGSLLEQTLLAPFKVLSIVEIPSLFKDDPEAWESEKENVERLRKGAMTDMKYRNFAQAACRKIRDVHKELPARLDSLHSSLAAFLEKPVAEKLARRRKALAACRKKYEDEVIAYFRQKAKQKVQAAHRGEADAMLRLRLNIETSQRLHLAMARLHNISCSEGAKVADGIRTDIALSELFDLSNGKTVVPKAREAVRAFKKRCSEDSSVAIDSPGPDVGQLNLTAVLALTVMLQGRGDGIVFPSNKQGPPSQSKPGGGSIHSFADTPGGSGGGHGFSGDGGGGSGGGKGTSRDNGTQGGDGGRGGFSYGDGKDRGDEVPFIRNAIHLRIRAVQTGAGAGWAQEFEKSIDAAMPSADKSKGFESELTTAAKTMEGFLQLPDAPTGSGVESPEAPPVEVPQDAVPAGVSETAGHIGSLSNDAKDRSEAFDRLDRAGSHGLTLLPGSVAISVQNAVNRLRNQYGLLNESALGPVYGGHSVNLGKALRTSGDSEIGREVRRELNFGLIILSSNKTTEKNRAEVRGSIGLLLGADAAASAGRLGSAGELLAIAQASLDSALGLSEPGKWQGGLELVLGMATGFGHGGEPMPSAEFALNGVQNALRTLNGKGGEEAAMTIVGKPVGKFFQRGASYVKNNSLGLAYSAALERNKQTRNSGPITSALGLATGTGTKVTGVNIEAFVGLFAGSTMLSTILAAGGGAVFLPSAGVLAGGVLATVAGVGLLKMWWSALHEGRGHADVGEGSGRSETGSISVDDFYNNTLPGDRTGGSTDQREKSGGFEQAKKDFDRLAVPETVENIEGKPGFRKGKTYDGSDISIRPNSGRDGNGHPTIQIEKTIGRKTHIKVRYLP